ncbi:hypothetical protein LTS18_003588, partial [Coniosporium uncinatum]
MSRGVEGYECLIDFNLTLYTLTWAGSMQYPDLSSFPNVSDAGITVVDNTSEMKALIERSLPLDFGAHASIRRLESDTFPIIKLAHPDGESRTWIKREHSLISALSMLDLPVPRVAVEPVVDDDVVCGYRMQALRKLSLEQLQKRRNEVRSAIERLHRAGCYHGDLSFSNIIEDDKGQVILIDFASSGSLGEDG